jgi:hypothetical protein
MRRVKEHLLAALKGQFNKFQERGDFILCVFMQSDFADAEHFRLIEKLGQKRDDFLGKGGVFRFFRVDAHPAVMANAVVGGPPRLPLGQLAKVIVKAARARAVVTHPKSRFANRHAARAG